MGIVMNKSELSIIEKCEMDEKRNLKLLSILKDKLHFHSVDDDVKELSEDVNNNEKPYHIIQIGKGVWIRDE